MKSVLSKVLDFIFPRHCINCGKPNPADGYKYLCAECVSGPFAFQVIRCKKCAEIVGSDLPVPSCAKCETLDFHFKSALVACEYAAAGRELVLELKYRNGLWVASDIAKISSRAKGFEEYFINSVIVPVPLSPSRKRSRGYNQSEVMAKSIAVNFPSLNVTVAPILKRKTNTKTQTALTRDERAKNVKGAFAVIKNSIPKDARIIVFDDVITSGATLNECAKILKRAGFCDISAFAFARRS